MMKGTLKNIWLNQWLNVPCQSSGATLKHFYFWFLMSPQLAAPTGVSCICYVNGPFYGKGHSKRSEESRLMFFSAIFFKYVTRQ